MTRTDQASRFDDADSNFRHLGDRGRCDDGAGRFGRFRYAQFDTESDQRSLCRSGELLVSNPYPEIAKSARRDIFGKIFVALFFRRPCRTRTPRSGDERAGRHADGGRRASQPASTVREPDSPHMCVPRAKAPAMSPPNCPLRTKTSPNQGAPSQLFANFAPDRRAGTIVRTARGSSGGPSRAVFACSHLTLRPSRLFRGFNASADRVTPPRLFPRQACSQPS